MVLLEDLHDDIRVPAVREERRSGVVEVGIRVPAGAELFHGEAEDLG
jgi:hypothetical protein